MGLIRRKEAALDDRIKDDSTWQKEILSERTAQPEMGARKCRVADRSLKWELAVLVFGKNNPRHRMAWNPAVLLHRIGALTTLKRGATEAPRAVERRLKRC